MLRVAIIAVLGLAVGRSSTVEPLVQGDDCLWGSDTVSSSEWGQDDLWNDAMFLVQAYSPSTAAEISDAVANGQVNIVGIERTPNPSGEGPDIDLAGSSDENTLGVAMVGRNAAEVAGTIIHEWEHIKGLNQDPPEDEDSPCEHASAYARQIDAAAAFACEVPSDPPTCAEFARISSNYALLASKCAADGGSHDAPGSYLNCGCT